MEIKRLRYWVQKVLPLVYDDSLSYYELLNKVVHKLNEVIETTNNYYDLFGIKIADPINWSIDSQYQQYTIVMDAKGNGYISKQPVPVNIRLDNEDYWTPIFNFGQVLDGIKIGITKYDFGSNPTTDVAISKGSLLYWNEVLYRAVVDMPIGTAFVVGTNIEEADLNDLLNDVIERVGDLKNDLGEEVTARKTTDEELQENIDNLNNTINELNNKIKYAQLEDEGNYPQIESSSDYVSGKGSIYRLKITSNRIFGSDPKGYIKVHVPSTPMTAPEVARLNKFRAMIGGPLRSKYSIKGTMYGTQIIPEAQYWFGDGTNGSYGVYRVGQIDDGAINERFNRFAILIWSPLITYGNPFNPPTDVMNAVLSSGVTFGDSIWNGSHPRQVFAYIQEEEGYSVNFFAFSGREYGDVGFTCPDMIEYLRNKYIVRYCVNMDGGGNTTLYSGVSRVQPPQNYQNRNTFGYLYADLYEKIN